MDVEKDGNALNKDEEVNIDEEDQVHKDVIHSTP